MFYGFLTIIFGVFLIYIGALSIAGAVLPKEMASAIGEAHGEWLRDKLIKKEQPK